MPSNRSLLLWSALILLPLSPFDNAAAAPRYQALECRGGGAMAAEYLDRGGSNSPALTIRFVRAPGQGDLLPGQCRFRNGELNNSDPTVLVYRARGERITQFSIAPRAGVTGVVGAGFKQLITSIQGGQLFTVWVSNSGRGWWDVQRLEP